MTSSTLGHESLPRHEMLDVCSKAYAPTSACGTVTLEIHTTTGSRRCGG